MCVFYGIKKREGERLKVYTEGISPCSSAARISAERLISVQMDMQMDKRYGDEYGCEYGR